MHKKKMYHCRLTSSWQPIFILFCFFTPPLYIYASVYLKCFVCLFVVWWRSYQKEKKNIRIKQPYQTKTKPILYMWIGWEHIVCIHGWWRTRRKLNPLSLSICVISKYKKTAILMIQFLFQIILSNG